MSLSTPQILCGITASEVLGDDTLSTTGKTVNHSQFNETVTPDPAVVYSGKVYALSAGAVTIDLTDLYTVGGGSADATGYKVQGFYFKNLGANPMTITEGGSNPYLIFGTSGSVVVQPGGALVIYHADASGDVGSSAKTIDVAGTGSQTFECAMILG